MNLKTIIGTGVAAAIVLAAIWIWSFEKTTSEVAARSVATPTLPVTVDPLEARIESGRLTLIGPVPDEEIRKNILNEARKRFGANNVFDALTISPELAAFMWYRSDDVYFPLLLSGMKQGLARFDGAKLLVEGFVENDSAKAALETAASMAVGGKYPVIAKLQVVQPVIDESPIASAPARVSVRALQQKLDAVMAGKSLEFVGASASLTSRSMSLLDQLAPLIAESEARIEVAGNTDNHGDAEKNVRLSRERAEEVCRYLSRHGVAPERLLARGYGAARSLALATSAADPIPNRSIEFRILEGR